MSPTPSPTRSAKVADPGPIAVQQDVLCVHLTPAEHRIFQEVIRGVSIKVIAYTFKRSLGTIKNQLSNILQKMECRSQIEMVARYNAGDLPMMLVDQTTTTNCGAAVVATLMRLPIEEVPNFWWPVVREDDLQNWLHSHQWACLHFDWDFITTNHRTHLIHGAMVVMIGPSSRNLPHAVVAELNKDLPKSYRVIHDPHKSRQGINHPTSIEYLFRTQHTPKLRAPSR